MSVQFLDKYFWGAAPNSSKNDLDPVRLRFKELRTLDRRASGPKFCTERRLDSRQAAALIQLETTFYTSPQVDLLPASFLIGFL